MDLLLIIFTVLIIAFLFLSYLLYKTVGNEKKHNAVFIANIVLAIILSFLAFTSLPSNYTVQRSIAVLWIVLASVASVLKYKATSQSLVPEILLSVSVFAALAQTLYI